MAYTPKPNTGRLWPNNRRTSENSPHLSGDGVFEGVPVWLSGWNQQDGSISIAMKPKTAQTPQQYQPKPAQAPPLFQQYKKPAGEPLPKDLPEHHVTKETFRSDTQEPLKDDEFDPDDIPF